MWTKELVSTVSRVNTVSIANPTVAAALRTLRLVTGWTVAAPVRRDGRGQPVLTTSTSVRTPPFVPRTLSVPTRPDPTRVIAMPGILLPADSVSSAPVAHSA